MSGVVLCNRVMTSTGFFKKLILILERERMANYRLRVSLCFPLNDSSPDFHLFRPVRSFPRNIGPRSLTSLGERGEASNGLLQQMDIDD